MGAQALAARLTISQVVPWAGTELPEPAAAMNRGWFWGGVENLWRTWRKGGVMNAVRAVRFGVAGAVLLAGLPGALLAQASQAPAASSFGLGVRAMEYSKGGEAAVTLGVDGVINLGPRFALQPVALFTGDVKVFAGRALYRVVADRSWSLYGLGSVGAWTVSGVSGSTLQSATETTTGFGIGAGVSVAIPLAEIPRWWGSLEVETTSAKFKQVLADFSGGLLVSAGVSYRL